jgi:hypothetical protein
MLTNTLLSRISCAMSDDQAKTMRVQLLMTPAEFGAIDDWMFNHRVHGRSEAIRQLLQLGMEYSAKKDAASDPDRRPTGRRTP